MDIPPSFWKLCRHFHQDIDSFVPVGKPPMEPEAPLVDYLVGSLLRDEQAELAGFLDWMLVQADAGARLMELWNQSQADFRMLPESRVDLLFSAIRRQLP